MKSTAFSKPYVLIVPFSQSERCREAARTLFDRGWEQTHLNRSYAALIVLVMKLTILLLTAGIFHAHAGVNAQSVSLSGRNITVKKILSTIKQQTAYVTFYSQDMLASAKPVSLDVTNMPLDKLLDLIAKDQPFIFEIKKSTKTIVLSLKPAALEVTPSGFPEMPLFQLITGQVTDSTFMPMPGATITVQGKNRNTVTDAQGRFQIEAESGNVLVVTYIGYQAKSIAVKNDTKTVQVILMPTVSAVDDVVITGIFNKSKESFTGATKTVTQKELQQFQGRNIFVTISNIDPSFYMVPNNNLGSNPNAVPDIQLRGTRNLPNIDQLQNSTSAALNTPLIILDGFPTTLQRMMDLNNNEIASITLLKDGSATALYGSQGSNGVVVITTRRPAGGKLRLTYSGNVNVSMPDLSSYDLLNAREKLALEVASGYYSNPTMNAEQNLGMEKYYNEVLTLVENGVNTDWMSKPLRTGVDQDHSLRLEGGDNVFRYSLTGQFSKINGVMKGSGRENVNGNVTLAYRFNKLNFMNQLIIGNNKSKESPWGSFADYTRLNPYWAPYDASGNITPYFLPYNYDYWIQGTSILSYRNKPFANPMYDATLNTFNKKTYTSIINNFQAEWKPTHYLRLTGAFGINGELSSVDDFKPASHSAFSQYSDADALRKGSYAYSSARNYIFTGRLSANYSNLFANVHGLTIDLSAEMSEAKFKNYSFDAEGFPDESIDFIGMALQYQQNGSPGGAEATTRRIGLIGSLNYIYDNRYFAELTYRVDGASQFGVSRRFAPFYAIGAGWNLHNESLIRDNLNFINRLKLRGSYGVTGNQSFGAYQSLATYSYIRSDRYKNWIGAYQEALGNPNLEWQKTGKLNIGFESDLFSNRLFLQADVYRENTSNLLSSLELPYANGFTSYIENVGALMQTGWELMARVNIIQNNSRRIFWSVTGNVSHNQDKITKLSEAMKAANEKLALQREQFSNNPNKIIRENTSQNTIYAVQSLGIDPSTGREIFLTKDGEATYSWNAADRVAVGIERPKYIGSFSTMFRYGGFSFNTSFRFLFGGQLYNQTLIEKIENADRFLNVDKRVFYGRWQKPGDKAPFRGLNEGDRTLPSSRFVQDESTLLCQNINLSYDVSNKVLLKYLRIQGLTITANTGELFYLSTVRQERGTEFPFSRQFTFRVFATF